MSLENLPSFLLNFSGTDMNGGKSHCFEFGSFRLNPSERQLLDNATPVSLTPKAFDVLALLVENAGHLVEKEELIKSVWPDSFVEEANLARIVHTLRRTLGEDQNGNKFIETIPKKGYRFVAEVGNVQNVLSSTHYAPDAEIETHLEVEASTAASSRLDAVRKTSFSAAWLLIIPVVICAGLLIYYQRPALGPIRSLAVLPLRSLDSNDGYIGLGIADAVIRRVSQTRELTVRPTSAILHFANSDVDALTAAKQLDADAVLDGTVQRSGERLRVSVNLLRTADGLSMWADNFDMPAADIFLIQDRVAQQVAMRLRLHLDSAQFASPNNKYPANPTAYEFYIKGVFSLEQRDSGNQALPQMETTIDFFKKAIEADPKYGLAHAQLAWAYVWIAVFIDVDPKWADLAREEINRSDLLDPNLAETHLAHAVLLWSGYEGFQNEAAIREMLLAQQIDPNSGHEELAWTYAHVGLDDLAQSELRRALEINPTSASLAVMTRILPWLWSDPDGWLSARPKTPNGFGYLDPWYYLQKERLDEAQKAIDERLREAPTDYDLLMQQNLLFALKGEFSRAEKRVPGILATVLLNDHHRHHATYDAARIFALDGKSDEAVKWLRETASTGYPNYPLFQRDPFLNRIRQTPEFIQFMTELKARWEKTRQEFGG